jgi:hypothetical protein
VEVPAESKGPALSEVEVPAESKGDAARPAAATPIDAAAVR